MRLLLALMLLLPVAAACGSRDFVIESGSYQLVSAAGEKDAAERALLAASVLRIDRAAKTVRLTYDGGELTGSFAPLDESAWSDGCPTNVSTAAMEVATLTPSTWTLRSLRIDSAMLVADCGLDPPSRGVLLTPAPVARSQPLCSDGQSTPCLGYARQ